jgi:hypothetical protein
VLRSAARAALDLRPTSQPEAGTSSPSLNLPKCNIWKQTCINWLHRSAFQRTNHTTTNANTLIKNKINLN